MSTIRSFTRFTLVFSLLGALTLFALGCGSDGDGGSGGQECPETPLECPNYESEGLGPVGAACEVSEDCMCGSFCSADGACKAYEGDFNCCSCPDPSEDAGEETETETEEDGEEEGEEDGNIDDCAKPAPINANCNPYCQLGCNENQQCSLSGGFLNCMASGPKGIGEICGSSQECAIGMACFKVTGAGNEQTCHQFCIDDESCPGDRKCDLNGNFGTVAADFCGDELIGCNPFENIVEECPYDCSFKECGDNGCNGSCGDCAEGTVCTNDLCVLEATATDTGEDGNETEGEETGEEETGEEETGEEETGEETGEPDGCDGVVCDDGNPCTVGSCVPFSDGTCEFDNGNEGEDCDDGKICTVGDACVDGICAGEPHDFNISEPAGPGYICCDDVAECSPPLDTCGPVAFLGSIPICRMDNLPDGSECNFNEECLSGECSGDGVGVLGTCIPGPACTNDPQCDDGDICTTDKCNNVGQCAYQEVFSFKGYPCCTPGGAPCTNDEKICGYLTAGPDYPACYTAGGAAGIECAYNEECESNQCAGDPKICLCQVNIDCDDEDDCTEDECNAGGLCFYSLLQNCGETNTSDN
jgi:hypothetical protein